MLTRRFAAVLVGGLLLALAGCIWKEQSPAPAGGAAAAGHEFHDRLLEIAGTYRSYGQVDDSMHWAPIMCDSPHPPAELRYSDSKDQGTHGRKLYAVFARFSSRGNYTVGDLGGRVGQVVVKESWVPEEVPEVDRARAADRWSDAGKKGEGGPGRPVCRPYARKDGQLYHAAKQADLFIMYKMDPETPGTDRGWVYGTVTADGKTVTSAGRVESCMKCHESAPHDRLFGLPRE